MNLRQMRQELASRLLLAVGEGEARAMADIIIEEIKGYRVLDIALYGHRELLPETVDRMLAIAEAVAKGAPLQYVLGNAYFRGRKFKVNASTLIPRPETAQLIDMVVDDYRGAKDARILDIGTGTGCIAISLALDLAYSQVDAIDFSPGALAIAEENAKMLKAKVDFIQADALKLNDSVVAERKYNAIVSNPPYVLDSEKAEMEARVVDYEPPTALFVPDNRPLLFYEAIARYATEALTPSGRLYFEINPLCASDLRQMLSRIFQEVEIIKDYRGKDRFAICKTL